MSTVPHQPDRSTSDSCETPRHEQLAWLVSVQDATEFRQAVQFDVDIVDLKSPKLGPLAPAPADLWRLVAEQWDGLEKRHQLSAALGEWDSALNIAAQLPATFDYAKAGPAGCSDGVQLVGAWRQLRDQLDRSTKLVAVAYADHHEANCLDPMSVLSAADDFGLRHILIDTYQKDGRSSLEKMGAIGLNRFADACDAAGMWWALAGQIQRQDCETILAEGICPNCVAVRGAICRSDRTDGLCTEKMNLWQNYLRN